MCGDDRDSGAGALASGYQRVERREAQESALPVQWLRVFKEHDHCRT